MIRTFLLALIVLGTGSPLLAQEKATEIATETLYVSRIKGMM